MSSSANQTEGRKVSGARSKIVKIAAATPSVPLSYRPASGEDRGMIARIWRGTVRAEDAPAYAEYVQQTGIEGYQRTPGDLIPFERQLVVAQEASTHSALQEAQVVAGRLSRKRGVRSASPRSRRSTVGESI
jgi:hypothetical protein